jgi:hypothetical protein
MKWTIGSVVSEAWGGGFRRSFHCVHRVLNSLYSLVCSLIILNSPATYQRVLAPYLMLFFYECFLLNERSGICRLSLYNSRMRSSWDNRLWRVFPDVSEKEI